MARSGLLCIGLTTVDIVAWPVSRLPEGDSVDVIQAMEMVPAGTAAGTALVAAKLGVRSAVASAVGADNAGKFIRITLADHGVDTTLLQTHESARTSTTFLAVSDRDVRPKLVVRGASTLATVTSEMIAAAKHSKIVHWAGIGARHLDDGPGANLLVQAKGAGAVITCDLIAPRPAALAELARVLPYVDYFLPSVAEASGLTGENDPDAAAQHFLNLGARNVIIKMGGRGSYVALGNARSFVPAHEITVVDTTSCGDSFCAGFIAGLDRGWSPLESVRLATATAALVAQGLGTLGKLESFDSTCATMRTLSLRQTVNA